VKKSKNIALFDTIIVGRGDFLKKI